ncbi:MAG TPA: ABC transporter substrate-binding protein [Halomonas sp.]|uniref:ABC transporter substrate-binding protein n=2 Tax=Halomonadaceae TaxID=28256 RepID=A0A3D0KE23_9GAMM|nr:MULTISPECIES: TRAP transporter substrate-binding protein DctP [Halomonas]HBP41482.1 ABC transporter substrate-binding protein [Halomonas sp.]HCA01783.1 ABC transporter substrate-binding protein [Halomonas campaniensis]AYF34644.1 ABC transporter substrate-binding protein [Halomonas alkaliphila]MCD6003823.1 TRAP transporter substrate-binding protein DctP [Halomonas sp. IOP_6]MDX5976605.1 TRAP transporter substrate-binding protein DctP [Halomonas alkaliphila]
MKLSTSVKCALATSIAASIMASQALYADTVRLRMHTFYGTEVDQIAADLRERVSEASDGTINIQFFRGGELVSSDQFVEAVARGSIDIGHGVGSYWPGTVGIGTIEGGLPGAWVSAEEAHDIFANQGLDELIAEAYEEQGVKLIGRGFGSDYGLVTREPVSSLEDLSSMRIRATSSIATVLEKFDIPTAFIPGEELYVALSTGVIDGAIYGGPVEYEQLRINEVAGYYTDINLLNPGWTENAFINPRTWERMSEEQQQILVDELAQYLEDVHNWLEEGNQRIIDEGELFEFATLPAEDSKRLAEASLPIWEEEAARSERNAQAVEILINNAKAQGRLSE